jgi:hypothetical protein
MPKRRYSGDPGTLFKSSTPVPSDHTRFGIEDGQTFLWALAAISARHRVGRTQTGDDLIYTEEGGSYLSVIPAGSADELRDQINRLKIAFERSEGRPPSDRDDAFWEAINAVFDAYDGPELGSIADVMGGLS